MTIAQISSSLPILDVLAKYGHKPDRNGKMCCPFHDDKHPSMMVYPKTNHVYCFSLNCRLAEKRMDGIDVIMHKEGISKHEAIEKAKSMISDSTSQHKTKIMLPTAQPQQNLDKIFYKLRQRYYRGSLAREYAKSRNLDEKKLELGFNPYSNAEFDKLKNCLVFPLKNVDDKVVGLYGRSISKNPRSKHFYKSLRSGLYPGYPEESTQTLIITEAIIDSATLISHLPQLQKNVLRPMDFAVLSLFGVKSWNEEHTSATKRLSDLREVIFFLDGDPAGLTAVETYAGIVSALHKDVIVSQVQTPEGEDANSLLDSHSAEIFSHLLDQREVVKGEAIKPSFLFSLESKSTGKQEKEGKDEEQSKGNIDPKRNDRSIREHLSENELGRNLKDTSSADHVHDDEDAHAEPINTDNPNSLTWTRHELDFYVIGGLPIFPVDRMLLTLGIERRNSLQPLHKIRQKINLYDDNTVEKFARKVAERLEMGTTRVHESIMELITLLEKHRQDEIALQKAIVSEKKELSEARVIKVNQFLEAPGLHDRTNELIGQTGLIGEEINRMILWYIYGHRKSDKPLHVMCLGASGTGKTYLQEKIGALMPEEEKKEITSMSDNAVYYFEENELVNKLLMIEDLDGANEQKILYALRELMSKTSVTKDVVIKDNKGKLRTISLKVNGPVCITGTTTKEDLYADNADRTIMIYLDGSPEQVQAILAYMRKLNAGKVDKYKQAEIAEFLQDVQRLLKPINIIIPYAENLVLPSWFLKQYRTNSHYQEFIKAVTFYHQKQRQIKRDSRNNPYIESTFSDIEIANKLMKDVLLAKCDELTKAMRTFYDKVVAYLDETGKESFKAMDIRLRYRMSPTAIGRYTKNLTKYGYFKIVSGTKRKGYEYEIEPNIEDRRGRLGSVLDEILEKIKEKYGQN